MSRRLPIVLSLHQGRKPSIDAVRAKLGGRASTEAGAGEHVVVTGAGGFEHSGVVIYTRGEDVDVWTAEGVVRRARRGSVRRAAGPASEGFAEVAVDAITFGGLSEGQRVRFRQDHGVGEGTLIEKCKFGALVERDDRTLVGVSFRRLWPADTN